MDRFILTIGIIGFLLFIIALIMLIRSIIKTIKREKKVTSFIYSLLIVIVMLAFASAFTYLSLFLQTFSRYTHEEKIGWVYAKPINGNSEITFYDEKANRMYFFTAIGDQWSIEGYILRWNVALRWLGADAYYRITRLSGRWEQAPDKPVSMYQLYPEGRIWRFLLTYAEKIPGVDSAYGIAAFQYPSMDTFYVYINDTGFILKKN